MDSVRIVANNNSLNIGLPIASIGAHRTENPKGIKVGILGMIFLNILINKNAHNMANSPFTILIRFIELSMLEETIGAI